MKMTLGEFIDRMKAGWGFAMPGRVQRIGAALDTVVPPEDRNVEVEVEYVHASGGHGPEGYSSYTWKVKGYTLPREGTLAPSLVDRIFGYSSLPFIINSLLGDGFLCGYFS